MSDATYFHERYLSKRETILANEKERRAARTPEQIAAKRAYNRSYHVAHQAAAAAKAKERRAGMTDAERSERRQKRRDYYEGKRAEIIEKVRIWNEQNPEKKRGSRILRAYGIDLAEYEARFASQEGRCLICSVASTETPKGLFVDHDHNTGRVRGLLCQACNMGIGQLGDSPSRLRAAADYLERALA